MKIDQKIANFEHRPGKFSCLPVLNKAANRPRGVKGLFIKDIFFDVPMFYRHEGLREIAWGKHKLDLQTLVPGDIVLFFNSDFSHIAIYGAMNSLQFIPAPKGQRISNLFLQRLPEIFGQYGYEVHYPSIVKNLMIEYLESKKIGRARKIKQIEA
jgi:hypothetical protein